MKLPSSRLQTVFLALLLLYSLAILAPHASAQGLDASALLRPATDTWPTYNGDYSGRRYSTLDQINASNVSTLTLAWAFRTPRNGIVPSSTSTSRSRSPSDNSRYDSNGRSG